ASPSRVARSVASSRATCSVERDRAISQPRARPASRPTRTSSSSTSDSMPEGYDNSRRRRARRVGTVVGMGWILLVVIVVVLAGLTVYLGRERKRRAAQALADAR